MPILVRYTPAPPVYDATLQQFMDQAIACVDRLEQESQQLRTELMVLQGRAKIAIEFMDWVLDTHPELSTTFKTCRQVEVRLGG